MSNALDPADKKIPVDIMFFSRCYSFHVSGICTFPVEIKHTGGAAPSRPLNGKERKTISKLAFLLSLGTNVSSLQRVGFFFLTHAVPACQGTWVFVQHNNNHQNRRLTRAKISDQDLAIKSTPTGAARKPALNLTFDYNRWLNRLLFVLCCVLKKKKKSLGRLPLY